MAKIFEIVRRLQEGEELTIHKKYAFTVMQQIKEFGAELGTVRPIKFDFKGSNCTMKLEEH